MPIYEYRCANGHSFVVIQRMSDDPVSACQECDAPVERVFHPVAVHFKGSGFYTTDYRSTGKSDGKPEPAKDSSDTKAKDSSDGGKGSGGGAKESGGKAKASSDAD